MHKEQTYPQTPSWSASKECWKHRRRYYIACGLAALFAFLMYLSQPNKYVAQSKITDEHQETDLLLGLDRTTALIKKSLPSSQEEGLKDPETYANILSSKKFCEELSTIAIDDSTDYYHYLLYNYRHPWWESIYRLFVRNNEKDDIIDLIQDCVKFSVSPKFATILIQVTDQHPRVAAHMADSVTILLQQAITRYRTIKKEAELANALKSRASAEEAYRKAMAEYASYSDANKNPKDKNVATKLSSLQQEAHLASKIYSKECIAVARAEALLQHATPSFTTLINPTTPHRASSPLLIVYLLLSVFLAAVFVSWYTLFQRSYGKEAES